MNSLGVPHEGSGGGPWGSGVLHGGHRKMKNYFSLKRPKIMFSEKNYFSPFQRVPARVGTENFRRKGEK